VAAASTGTWARPLALSQWRYFKIRRPFSQRKKCFSKLFAEAALALI
jgi:hypothetical protein